MNHPTSLLSVLASVLALFLASCANKSVTLGPDGKPIDSQGKPTNPFPPGTYEHFKAEPDYPKTMKTWKNDQLLSSTNESNSRIVISLPIQRGFLMKGDEVVIDYPISSGVPSRPTPTGNYKILEKIVEGHDFVQGSRFLKGGGYGGDMPMYRKFATALHPRLMSLATGTRLTESTNGFRAVRMKVFDDPRINLDQAWLNEYELEPYLLFKALKLGYRHTEVPVHKIYPSRKIGYTKMKPISGWWSILRPVVFLGLGLRK